MGFWGPVGLNRPIHWKTEGTSVVFVLGQVALDLSSRRMTSARWFGLWLDSLIVQFDLFSDRFCRIGYARRVEVAWVDTLG
jgi:hypothetical protein